MNNLQLKYKFILIIILASIPAVFATYLLAQNATQTVDFASKEITGSTYLQRIRNLHQIVGEHRVAYMSSLVDKNTQITDVRRQFASGIDAMNSTHGELNNILELGDSWNDTRTVFNSLLNTKAGLDYEAANHLHNEAINAIAALIQKVGDNSNLILDPDLDSYYMMDAAVLKILPAIALLSSYTVEFTEKSEFMFEADQLYTLENIANVATTASDTINIAASHNAESSQILSAINNKFKQSTAVALASFKSVRVNSTPTLMDQAFVDANTAITSGYELFDAVNAELERLLQNRISNDKYDRNVMLTVVIAAIAIAMFFTFAVGQGISNTIIRAKTVAEAIAEDQLDNSIIAKGRDEPAQLMKALAMMQENLHARINEERQQSITNGRIKQALECVSSPVLVADVDKHIIYSNIAANRFFESFQTALANDIKGFSHKDILGQPMDFLCRGQALSISNPHDTSEPETDWMVGGRHLRFITSPVTNDQNQIIGTVVEIRDRTDEVSVEQAVGKDVMGLVDDALLGNLSGSIDAHDKPDFLVPVYNGINDMVGVCNSVISSAGEVFKRLAHGDLSASWSNEKSVALKGDFLQLHNDANATIVQLSTMIAKLKGDAAIVSANADSAIQVNSKLEANALSASQQANSVSDAINSISGSVDSIAGAAEQMSSSIKEIVRNTQRSTTVAEQASDLTRAADDSVSQLASSSQDIGNMVKVINSIAEQTNLLALNATIEAARAGDAGKGFAVVANEVKELAKETAKATEDISVKIHAIQSESNDAADGIRKIDTIVQQINDLQNGTAVAMEQQSATTQEISRNINTVAIGTSGITTEVSELVQGTVETTQAVNQAKDEVIQLNQVAGNLQSMADNFNLGDTISQNGAQRKAA